MIYPRSSEHKHEGAAGGARAGGAGHGVAHLHRAVLRGGRGGPRVQEDRPRGRSYHYLL